MSVSSREPDAELSPDERMTLRSMMSVELVTDPQLTVDRFRPVYEVKCAAIWEGLYAPRVPYPEPPNLDAEEDDADDEDDEEISFVFPDIDDIGDDVLEAILQEARDHLSSHPERLQALRAWNEIREPDITTTASTTTRQ